MNRPRPAPNGLSHHGGLRALYCRLGSEGAHEKGGVEGQIGYFRRNHFVPVPEVSSLAELNEMVEQWDRQDDARRIGARSKTVAECFALEQPLLMPLREEPFETGRLFTPNGRLSWSGIDGIFGSGTRNANILCQRDWGLGDDGVVGKDTFGAADRWLRDISGNGVVDTYDPCSRGGPTGGGAARAAQ
ncbi:hypothetical protein ACFVZC_03395 [Streptomyces marokkonensis]|uniref:Uncharacterized protein n=1 Tax=Streptomyces marokkonensis TaxID=324855 RepID=A0ABW6PZT5_9ACTN